MADLTHWRKFHPTEYIGAADFEPDERKIVTIQRAGREVVKDNKGKSEECLVAHFKESGTKPMIVNVTNAKAISKVSGSQYIENWVGTPIELFTTEVQAFGEVVDAVRVKPTAPRIEKPVLNEKHSAYKAVQEAVQEGYTREQVESKYKVSDAVWNSLTATKTEE